MRAIVQLLLVGMVLKTVFALASPLLIGAVALAMFVMASYEISTRQQRRFAGAWGYGIGAGTTMNATLLVTAFALLGTLRPVPWYAPEVLIPLLGIILGNVMNGVSVTLNALSTSITRERPAIEARLALGADRYAALKPLQRGALRSDMIPIINQMSAAGVITLPVIMSGRGIACGYGRRGGGQISDPPPVYASPAGAGLGALAAVYPRHLANHRRTRPFAARSAGAAVRWLGHRAKRVHDDVIINHQSDPAGGLARGASYATVRRYGQEELERAGAYRVYEDPADLLRHIDEVGGRR